MSLQTLLECPVVVGGRTALELHGLAHYLPHQTKEVHLYGPDHPPNWLHRLSIGVAFVVHNSHRLFRNEPATRGLSKLSTDKNYLNATADLTHDDVAVQPWGQWGWPLALSAPERAILELLDELPKHESFHQVDQLFGSLATLSPRRATKLLANCRSVKVKRLFLFFANRHDHAWLKSLDRGKIDLGRGNRLLVKGGKLDPATRITVPVDLDGVR